MTLFTVGQAIFGVFLALSGILTLAGKTRSGPVWLSRRLSGTGQLGIGVFLFLTGLFPRSAWALIVAAAAFLVSAVCVLLAVIKLVRSRPRQDWPS